jgi:hypothetical protein
MTGAVLVINHVTAPDRVQAGGRHRKQALHRKETEEQRFSSGWRLAAAVLMTAVVAVLGIGGLPAKLSPDDSVVAVSARQPPSPIENAPVQQRPAELPAQATSRRSAEQFASDDKGFIDSSARCQGSQPAFAIGRTKGSLVVICAEQTGRYEYLGVRLRDDALLRTDAETDSSRGFFAHRAGVVYAVSPTELRVTSGDTVIKQEPMIEYRVVPR